MRNLLAETQTNGDLGAVLQSAAKSCLNIHAHLSVTFRSLLLLGLEDWDFLDDHHLRRQPDNLRRQLDNLGRQLDSLRWQLDSLRGSLDDLRRQLDNLRVSLDDLGRQLDILRGLLNNLGRKLRQLDDRFHDLGQEEWDDRFLKHRLVYNRRGVCGTQAGDDEQSAEVGALQVVA